LKEKKKSLLQYSKKANLRTSDNILLPAGLVTTNFQPIGRGIAYQQHILLLKGGVSRGSSAADTGR
jgi:hypothetical protein